VVVKKKEEEEEAVEHPKCVNCLRKEEKIESVEVSYV